MAQLVCVLLVQQHRAQAGAWLLVAGLDLACPRRGPHQLAVPAQTQCELVAIQEYLHFQLLEHRIFEVRCQSLRCGRQDHSNRQPSPGYPPAARPHQMRSPQLIHLHLKC